MAGWGWPKQRAEEGQEHPQGAQHRQRHHLVHAWPMNTPRRVHHHSEGRKVGDCVSELIETDVQKPLKLGLKIKIELQKKILKVIYLLSKVSSLSHNHAESIILSLFIAIKWVQIQPHFSELEDFVPKLLNVKETDPLESLIISQSLPFSTPWKVLVGDQLRRSRKRATAGEPCWNHPWAISNRTLGKEKMHMGKESAKTNQYFHTRLSNSRKICFLEAIEKPIRMGVLQGHGSYGEFEINKAFYCGLQSPSVDIWLAGNRPPHQSQAESSERSLRHSSCALRLRQKPEGAWESRAERHSLFCNPCTHLPLPAILFLFLLLL